jgi:predicted KAP-like P-loop ATPase
MEATDGLALPVHFVMVQQQADEKADPVEGVFVISSALDELRRICVKKIEAAALSGTLVHSPHLIYILYRWKGWSSANDVRRWCDRVLDEDGGVVKLLKAFTLRSIQVTSDNIQHENWYVRLKYLEDFVSLERVNERLEKLSTSSLTPDEIRAVTAYREAGARREQGKKDFGEEPFQ